ncbi:MAG TPA: thioredoxin family protein [Thermoanaerobaculia bacterium]|nr:thioredoxin family protein [Thermoanaerobaculia bacterium]
MNPRALFALFLGLSVCSSFARPAASAPPTQKKSDTPAPTPAVPEGPTFDPEAVGEKQIADYQKVCLDSGRRLLLVFGTNECAPCRAFNRALHKDKFFEAFINQFVPVFVDVSSGTNAVLLVHYNIDTRAEQPGIVILMPDARILEVLAHGEMAALTRKGDAAVQEYFLARFLKTDK